MISLSIQSLVVAYRQSCPENQPCYHWFICASKGTLHIFLLAQILGLRIRQYRGVIHTKPLSVDRGYRGYDLRTESHCCTSKFLPRNLETLVSSPISSCATKILGYKFSGRITVRIGVERPFVAYLFSCPENLRC